MSKKRGILSKLRVFDSETNELDLEAVMLWIFLLITAFRALLANLTLTLGPDIKWTIPDINLAATLPMLYSLLSNSHRRYLQSKNGGTTNGQPTDPGNSNPGTAGISTTGSAGGILETTLNGAKSIL